MIDPAEEMLKELITCDIDLEAYEFNQWFLKKFQSDANSGCSLEEFAVYFLNTLRHYTDIHLKTIGTEITKCQTQSTVNNSNKTEEAATPTRILTNTFQLHATTSKGNSNHSSCCSKNNTCIETETYSSPRLSSSVDRMSPSHIKSTSTPITRNVLKNTQKLSSTPGSASKTNISSLCLGDFLISYTPTHNRSHKKKIPPTANPQSDQKLHTEKPKKRLQPISIKKVEESSNNSFIFTGKSSFSNENNILKISNTELEDKDQCAILAARKSLALNASEIKKEIESVSMPLIQTTAGAVATSTPDKEITTAEIPLDLKKMQNNLPLTRLAKIYVLIIDLNLTTNILNELSFLLNLLNSTTANNLLDKACKDVDQLHLDDDLDENVLSMLKDSTNAVYFALLCLEHEKHSLASLDAKSLGVVLITERFSYLPDHVQTYLLEIYQRKQQLMAEKPFYDSYLCYDSKACNNVYFQHEQDSRENFSSYQEFSKFRAQRDLFYTCLKIWECNHLNPMWNFSTKIGPKIVEIFQISENCINMAHLAKLFVSQLLISSSNTSSPEEIGLDVDMLKLSKLTQRLIAPSQFCVDYQFPRTEAFFRDFILKARSLAFVEQLKMELYAQLIAQNDSSLDHISISKTENDAEEENMSLIDCSQSDFLVVRPDILTAMLILAKFLGFTISLPYNTNSCNTIPTRVEKNQVILRSLMQPTFDICALLEQAIEQSKLLITIPWLVQYLVMLDNITLQLENYTKTIKLLFTLYSYLGVENPTPLCTTSIFLIKICLGWLFESKQFIAEQYYNYRSMLRENSLRDSGNELDLIRNKLRSHIIVCNKSESTILNSYLESLLPIACPFLAEFRVSIMPAKQAQIKNASRTGRYRHITTRIAESSSVAQVKEGASFSNTEQNDSKDVQNLLIQAFLHSQSPSTRQVIKFCTERCYKTAVKDGQLKILLPAKTKADNLVNQITSSQYNFVYNNIKTIYDEAYASVKADWNDSVPKILHKSIHNALESLLPEETSAVLKRTYFMIIAKEASSKINQWFYNNIIADNYFCPSLHEIAEKVCTENKNKIKIGSTQLTIIQETPTLSDLIDELQYWLHCTSIRVERFKDSKPLVQLLKNLIKSFENELPYFLYNLLGAGIVQLFQHIISKNYSLLSDELIEIACQVWLHPNMQKALNSFFPSGICIYDALITITFLESLGTKTEYFHQLGHLITIMIRKQIFTVNYVNEVFVSIFKYEWHPFVLNEISNMLRYIAKETSDVPRNARCDNNANDNDNDNDVDDDEHDNDDDDDEEKSNLFMDMLADLSRDVDFV